jgi:hypothetical protein
MAQVSTKGRKPMSTQPANPASPAPIASPAKPLPSHVQQIVVPIRRSWKVATVVAVVMVLLAILGVALTTTNSSFAQTYWMTLVPIYGLLCVGTAAISGHSGSHIARHEALKQVLHWLGIAVALSLDFSIRAAGQESAIAAGLNALLLLALGSYLAGLHLEWPFVLVGIVLSMMVFVIAKTDQYLWLAFLAGMVGIAGLVALWLWGPILHHKSSVAAAPTAPAGS